MEFTLLRGFDYMQLKKWQMDVVLKKLHKAYKKKYRNNRSGYQCKFRAFTDTEIKQFFRHVDKVDDYPFWMLWQIMKETGIRPEEARKLRITDFLEQERQMRIVNWKVNERIDCVPISRRLTKLLHLYIYDNLSWLRFHNGQLFPTITKQAKTQYISAAYLRNKFAQTRKRAGLSKELCNYSFRKYAIQKVYELTKDPHLCKIFARHRHFSTTSDYYLSRNTELIRPTIETLSQKII